ASAARGGRGCLRPAGRGALFPGGGGVGTPPVPACGGGPAGKALARDDTVEAIAGAVALRAMARTVDEISAAIPQRRLGRVGLELLPVEKEEFPASEHAADLEMERQVVAARPSFHRRRSLEGGEEIAHTLATRARGRRVRA